ncbi:F-box only protein 28 isoform X1 [Pieris brassicae]|uniref:F-box only protein 28 isoform X1 n=1 Tax=Pieris brassicae TaxID=7116 RepID=UPI001E660E42|nr:F-box only protein 28 isoform X1 [Pieris brassicae]
MDFLSLPVVVVEKILSYLSYDEVSKYRMVSKGFNDICMRMLNRGFLMIERRHALALKGVKAQLPRRESERRYHPLARHCDILTSIETRISMLNMTYSKFMDCGICCFIPGKVIDEIRRVLSLVETSKTPPRAHEVLQELRDISSMAIEHFDDKVSPDFRKKLHEGVPIPEPRPSQVALLPLALRQEMLDLRRRTVLNAKLSLHVASQYKKFYKRIVEYRQIAWRQRKTIRDLKKRQRDQDACMADLKKRIEECDIKYSKLTHADQTVGGTVIAGNRIFTSANDSSGSVAPLRHFGSQIKLDLSVLPIGTNKRNSNKLLPNMKPRKPQIRLPSLSEDVDMESNPVPSTSNQTPRQKTQCTMAKIRGITNEIRQLSNLSKTIEGKLKRPRISNSEDLENKKQKLQ